MSIVPFEMPEEIKNISYRSILQNMLAAIPDNVDKTEGGFVYDMVSPAALEAAELIQFWLVLGLKNGFHQWAEGRWLDYCAYDVGLERRDATYAYGNVSVTTSQGVTFPKGFIFSVPSIDGAPAIDFETTEAHSYTEAGTYKIRVKAVLTGPDSNVKADSINIMKNPIAGIADITNEEALSGGTNPEDDASLRQRIDDYYAGRMASFVGNKKDYVRWAKEVDGVGYAHCIPTYDGPNTVKVVVADFNGVEANEEILAAVELHIFGTGHNDLNRLAPIGIVKYEVVAPKPLDVFYSVEVKLVDQYTLNMVKTSLEENLQAFYKTLPDDDFVFGVMKYIDVADVVYHTEGVADFQNLYINGETRNIDFGEDCIPHTAEIQITSYN